MCAVLAVQLAACGDSSSTSPGGAGTAAPAAGTGTPPATPTAGGAGTTGTTTSPVSSAGTSAGAGRSAGASGTGTAAPAAGSGGAVVSPAAGSGGAPAAAGTGAVAGTSAQVGGAGGGQPPAAGASGAPGTTSPVTCPSTTLMPGDSRKAVGDRYYLMHVPQKYDGKTPVPLVVDLHPLLTDAMLQKTNSGYQRLSDSENFIVVWPNGIDNAWNIGPCCTRSRDVDDLGFIRTIVDEVKKAACIDPKRVYADGYSMGGGMTHHLACRAADVFAAVAPSAFDLLEENVPTCTPPRPVSQILFRGTSDPIVPYRGGASNPPNGLNVTIHFLGAEGTFKKWSEI
ncbi:MAG TPA: PHB depolymerase family esterase, partial [Polyangiales bacterium]|nr:PHB depolymerase family esterase [Polyangiales bacterium]